MERFESDDKLSSLGVNRVYFVTSSELGDEEKEPDAFHYGMAPSVKLLSELVARLCEIDPSAARRFVGPWRDDRWALYRRMWAAAARNAQLAQPNEIAAFLLTSDDEQFWLPGHYPEVAELRAVRFADLSPSDQHAVEARLRRLPPSSLWRASGSAREREQFRKRRAIIEMRRITAAGAVLSANSLRWMETQIKSGLEVPHVPTVRFGFVAGPSIQWGRDDETSSSFGPRADLLGQLEAALSQNETDSPVYAVDRFMSENVAEVVAVLEEAPDHGAKNPYLWRRMGWVIRPTNPPVDDVATSEHELAIARRLVTLARSLPQETLFIAVTGLAAWMEEWARHFRDEVDFVALWHQLWPVAVVATNSGEDHEEDDLEGLIQPDPETQIERLARGALETPVGRLVGAFFKLCPDLGDQPKPFEREGLLSIRDELLRTSSGRARLQVLHRLLEKPYFQRADPLWFDTHLISPLLEDDYDAIELWDAIGRRPVLPAPTMSRIGARMAEVACSPHLPSETRAHLAERVVYRVLLDREESAASSVSDYDIQQMLRLGDDNARASAGRILGTYIEGGPEKTSSKEERLRNVVIPFFEAVWPRELTLRSRQLSDALANLPAKCGTGFVDAAHVIYRYLTPFDCWSLWEYGIYEGDAERRRIRGIETPGEAEAFLGLLDRTIGSEERAIVPNDLDRGLSHISLVDPRLARDPRFQRLNALARR
jgi:hypothetical protein